MKNYTTYRTAESVSPRHPDKLCDQISDAILDGYLEKDPNARVAVETCGGHGIIYIVGEVTSSADDINVESIAREIAGDDMEIHINLVKQSPEIAGGVDLGGAGDQGIMIGYATDETTELMPREVILSRQLNQHIYQKFPFDGKTQVTLKILEKGNFELDSIVASFQNSTDQELRELVEAFIHEHKLAGNPRLHLNPAGEWHQGGFEADTGLTGRKLAVDNYGPRIPIGGGAFSGKDPSKVDRSAAYMARRIAVDYLRARKAKEVFVRLAYAIGYAEPLERTVIVDGKDEQIPLKSDSATTDNPNEIHGYDLTPRGIIDYLDLKRPIYQSTACYGHFGAGFDWDKYRIT